APMKPNHLNKGEDFVIQNYNAAAAFSSFFPALAGERGKPMWVFYANRGQAIASFGVNNKDGAMVEFLPANKAYQAIPSVGFRTFLRFDSSSWYEPFAIQNQSPAQKLIVRPYEIELIDLVPEKNLELSVVNFGVPNEKHPLLGRIVTFTNRSKRPIRFSIVDG